MVVMSCYLHALQTSSTSQSHTELMRLLFSACHETELSIEPDSISPDCRLNIGVVGSGPAGMSFAFTAATIGHHVTLFEKSNEIGGTKVEGSKVCVV